ncbi:NADH:flavin oxidoreductase/NADH oxidase OS=Tsukamurella paurometabola (strain ATCC 8368 / DSM/ CCUG 35730 / CIP 100753 / JCM 10117 / KCTC 9821 / NBRC 16120/ NCIMB 702349 / NCTC 13040) OX=521096 GN=Tpau_2459 PE=4 SV=1 [Tsukamurella paurometabola]|uniref:NADH:flavin oxidoreductase/NADH oxidase n=1 Tax=Tsukamurella paurometabola (strain ATCC 8368 / DSM 20162 / CCUG 35730 / CIP 100753 / JCM 10117 / KCTC 9821 / NBRC 16120 / NCIMB 702349 / NCTC 13040) TaxID=521096 RepID=D5UR75_TSUPD|nr:alkene reductase [Tsukamurella paurometabola]ADG79064.1 NADH:flavin oxidoreductase/NADH oxidase [Tsukamurella paurometabola DSM 20162]SUP33950.1 N-ethylmaleimide reductase [Tsukamurella paurometabola]
MRLLTPYRSDTLAVPNRIVMAPMTRLRSTEDGSPTTDVIEYYRQRASAGLLVTEGIWPHSLGQSEAWIPGLQTAAHQHAWAAVASAVHSEGGRIVAQLMHGGRKGHPAARLDGSVPAGPSAVPDGDVLHLLDGTKAAWPAPSAMSLAAIEAAIDHYAASARRAIDAGFDGVELHGANSYLIHQFLADNTNLRSDRYGGSVHNRMRFAVEVVDAVAEEIGADRTALRLSPGNPQFSMIERDPAPLYRALIDEMSGRGLLYLHLTDDDRYPALADLRPRFDGPLIANIGENRAPTNAAGAEEALRRGLADLVSFGRAFIANPDLVERIRTGTPLSEIREDVLYGRTAAGYTDYPSALSACGNR